MASGCPGNVVGAYRFLVETYEPDDDLFLLGFSRGAFTTRSLAGPIRNGGILCRDHADGTKACELTRMNPEFGAPTLSTTAVA